MIRPFTRTFARFGAGALTAMALSASALSAQPAAKPIKVTEDKPGQLAKAKIAPDSALAIARKAVPGGVVTEAEIEVEDGALLYSILLTVAGKKGVEEIHVDAATGKVLAREHEDAAAAKPAPAKAKPPAAKPPTE